MTVPLARRREMLAELAADRARMVAAGLMDLHEAVDGLAEIAQSFGIPVDAAQAIIAEPFADAAHAPHLAEDAA